MYTRDGSGGFNDCSDFPKSLLRDGHLRRAPSCAAVSEQRPSDVLGALPRRRPQRRSAKRAAPVETANGNGNGNPAKPAATKAAARARKPGAAKPAPTGTKPAPPPTTPGPTGRRPQRLAQPAQPAGVPATSHARPSDQPTGRHLLGTAAQAAAELAEIGLSVSARALRGVVDRLPRP
jgi:hypothetical protein